MIPSSLIIDEEVGKNLPGEEMLLSPQTETPLSLPLVPQQPTSMIPSSLIIDVEVGENLSREEILLSQPQQQPTRMTSSDSITGEGVEKSALIHSSGEKPFLSPSPPPSPPPPSQKQQKQLTRMIPSNVSTGEDSLSPPFSSSSPPPPPPPPPPSWRRQLKRKKYLAREDKEEEEEEEEEVAVGSSSFPGLAASLKPYHLSSSDSLKRSRSSRFPSWSYKVEYPDIQDALEAVYEELEMERRASTTAVNEALAMIARLQEEKSYLGMAACQYRRFAEEREAHDLETIALLEDLLVQEKAKGSIIDSPDGVLYRRPLHPHHQHHLMALALKPGSEIEADDESEEKHIISLPGADKNSTFGDGSRSEETYRQDNSVSLDFRSSSSSCDEDSLDQKVGAMSNKDEISVTTQESSESSVWDRIRNLDERLHILSEHQKQMLSLDFEPTTARFHHPDPHRMESTQSEFFKTREWLYESPKDFQDKVVEIYEVQRERESNLLEDSEVQEIHSTEEENQNLQGFIGEQKYFQHSMHNYHDRSSDDKQLAFIMATRKWLNERIKAHCKPSYSSSSIKLNGKMDQSHQLAEEVEILSAKLKQVKTERDSMMQEILSLRKENNELKAAEDVSKQLRAMRGRNANKAGPSHVGISTQQEGSFLLLLFKAFLSFIGLHHKRLDFEKCVEEWNPEENDGMLEMQRLRMTRRTSAIGGSLASDKSPITINEASALQYRPISNFAQDRDFSSFILRWLCV